ncbi:MAG TPA: hypothetical protein VH306_00540 [Gaiellaceae bacterium]|jgi:hypothetical protein
MTAAAMRPSLREPLAVWAILAAVALATLATYDRIDPGDLWNVSGDGIAAGLGRALVDLNFPAAFVAIAIVLVVEERVRLPVLAGVAIALCAVTAVPGVVRQSDLDARWINALPALGVAVAAGMTVAALLRGGLGRRSGSTWVDAVRLVLAAVLLAVAVPWIAAALGFHVNGPYLSSKVIPEAGHPHLAAVHLGLHHGLDGTVLALSALVLSRVTGQLAAGARRTVLAIYLSVMLVYGLANVANDAWDEQVVKRGWAHSLMPGVTTPSFNGAWLGVILAAAALSAVVLYRLGRAAPDAPPPARVPV